MDTLNNISLNAEGGIDATDRDRQFRRRACVEGSVGSVASTDLGIGTGLAPRLSVFLY